MYFATEHINPPPKFINLSSKVSEGFSFLVKTQTAVQFHSEVNTYVFTDGLDQIIKLFSIFPQTN